ITGPFGPQYASGNGFAPGGIGWYRKHFRIPANETNRVVTVEFDGVYDHSEVWVNGVFVGGRPYGYSSFALDVTPCLRYGKNDNVIAVRVDHSRFADSRWYSGSGIYRHVRLCLTEPVHLAHWGTFITTPKIRADEATVEVATTITNGLAAKQPFQCELQVLAPDGRVVAGAAVTGTVAANTARTVRRTLRVSQPTLWSTESPMLYTLRSRLLAGTKVVDETATSFGIRTAKFDPDKGFFLNGRPLKIKGVCLHGDAGCLGVAVPDQVLERRLRILKSMGVNAIRTSHNPPAPELLSLCDRLGLLVKEEAFDEFTPSKKKWVTGRNNGVPSRFGYSEDFAQWSVTDISDMVRRDRNHPCIILWSIGNEIDFANDPFSDPVLGAEYHPENPPARDIVKLAAPLIAAVKSLDTTRPVTAALANLPMSEAVGFPEMLDAVGYNYQEPRYAADHRKFPRRIIYGSETSHRYDAWLAVKTNDFVAGQFLWTGIDYLGEAGEWPNHGSPPGLLDLCGFKKPLGWFRQSLWSDLPMVHLCAAEPRRESGWRGFAPMESWNWASNAMVTVICYANCPEVTLLLNGGVIGTKQLAEATDGVLRWRVPFAPGELKAIGSANGTNLCQFALQTAGPASRIELAPDVTKLDADGTGICHLEFRIVDAAGVRVPGADDEVTFSSTGPVKLLGIENGDLNSTEPYGTSSRRALHGRGLAIFESTTAAGTVRITATSPGLEPATVELEATNSAMTISD
ncbi:MAG TPA: glycoside hydrolase family 2 TIM barrel-domain containing protein, partial [Verrucomicrobiae bacterium]|nr:glycoside hydrolase family 2 TIM barrel-domain containing protein [Verrucomicrobiae bacterium]